jgi:UDP-GlcNAc:undecaprenyl-phosphate GlcNAc-1-phosphate transferase
VGFWFYNYAPASIFMGDGGSHFLGYLLAVSSAGTTYFNPEIAASKISVLIPLCRSKSSEIGCSVFICAI